MPIDESKRGFWDDFSSIPEQQRLRKEGNSSIGTSAMGKGSGGGAKGGKRDDWDDW